MAVRTSGSLDARQSDARDYVPLQECIDQSAPICYGILMPGRHVDDGVPVVKVRDLLGGEVRLSALLRAASHIEAPYRRSRLKPNDVLLTIRGSAGTAALVPQELDGANITQDTARIRVHPGHDARFVRYSLMSSATQRFIAYHTVGQAVKGINIRDVRRIPVPAIALAQQRLIADTLDAAESATRLARLLLLAKQRFKLGLTQQLIDRGQRGNRPSSVWREVRLGDLFTERTESGRSDLPLLAITADRGIVSRDEIARRDTSNADKGAYLRICEGDIGYNTMRMWQGVSALSTLEGIISPAYTVCIPGPKVDAAFAAQYFKFPPIVDVFRRHSQGLVDDTLNLKFHHFARIRLAFPPLDQQRTIAGLLTLLDHELRLADQLAAALERQKRSLLEKLLSGEIRVPTT